MPIPVADLIARAAVLFNTTAADIIHSRFRLHTHTRYAVAFAAVSSGRSQGQTGKFLGGRDHSTIGHAIRRAQEIGDQEPRYRRARDELCAMARDWKAENHQELLPRKVVDAIKRDMREMGWA